MKSLVLAGFLLCVFSSAQAVKQEAQTAKTTPDLRSMAVKFYSKKAMIDYFADFKTSKSEECDPKTDKKNCVRVVCSKLSKWDCDDLSELEKVSGICAKVYDASCIENTCSWLSKWDCDDFSDLQRVAKSCSGQYDGNCVSTICGKLSQWDCDDISEIEKVGLICKSVDDSGCIEAICSQLSKWDCDDFSDLEKVAKACKDAE